jgi:WD40 repeat protein
LSPDGRRIASFGGDGNVLSVRETRTGDLLASLALGAAPGSKVTVDGFEFTRDGSGAAWVQDGSVLKRWVIGSVEAPVALGVVHKPTALFSLFTDVAEGDRIVAECETGLRASGAGSGAELFTLSPRTDAHPFLVCVGGGRAAFVSAPGTVQVWDTDRRRGVQTLYQVDGPSHGAFTPDGSLLALCDLESRVKVYDIASNSVVSVLVGHRGIVEGLAFSPDGRRIVTRGTDRSIRVWSTMRSPTFDLSDEAEDRYLLCADVNRVAVQRWQRDDAVPDPSVIEVLDVENGGEPVQLRGHEGPIASACFTPDGRRLVSLGEDQTLRWWDVESGQQFAVLRGPGCSPPLCAVFSPDARRMAFRHEDGKVAVWDTETGREIALLPVKAGSLYAFCHDGRQVVTGESNGTIRVWDTGSGRPLKVVSGHQGAVEDVAVSPDGRRIVSSGADPSHVVRLWDVESGRQLLTLRGQRGAQRLRFSPDGRRILSLSEEDGLLIWDATTGRELLRLDSSFFFAEFSRDGRRILANYGYALHVLDASPLSEEVLARREADGLARFQARLASSRADLVDRIGHDRTVSEGVRALALKRAWGRWEVEARRRSGHE